MAGLDRGLDVVCEKPMTIDAPSLRRIVDAADRSAGNLIVTFNYRYSPRNTLVRQIIADGLIGDVTSVHFEWCLDTVHGADYFRRWHREKSKSGGLLVHKSTHHFDLVNWWIDDVPDVVFALGRLRFYGRENAQRPRAGDRAPSWAATCRAIPSPSTSPPTRSCRPCSSKRSRSTGTSAIATCSRTASRSRTT